MNPDCYPDFIIIGAAKSGTTSLAAMLEAHPDVFVTSPKEPHYFTFGWEVRREWYESLFAERTELFKGEASTTYTQGPYEYSVPQRIQQTVPDANLIYLIRDPVERIRSQYLHWVDRGKEHRKIDVAVREDPRYIEHTKYGYQLREFLRFFPRSQILVIANESLRSDPRRLVRGTLDFIGADPERLGSIPVLQMNRSIDKRRSLPMLRSLRTWARQHGVLRFTPSRGRLLLHRLLSRRLDQNEGRVSTELASYIWKRLESDQALLRTLVEPSFPTWLPDRL